MTSLETIEELRMIKFIENLTYKTIVVVNLRIFSPKTCTGMEQKTNNIPKYLILYILSFIKSIISYSNYN